MLCFKCPLSKLQEVQLIEFAIFTTNEDSLALPCLLARALAIDGGRCKVGFETAGMPGTVRYGGPKVTLSKNGNSCECSKMGISSSS